MGLFRATVHGTFPVGGGGGTNSWHLRTVSDDGTLAEVATLMALVEDFYQAVNVLWPTSESWSWDGTALQVAEPAPRLISGGTPWTVAGLQTSGYAPVASMVCVSWRSDLATRRGRGRTFLGPIGLNSADTDGTPANAHLSTVRTAAATLVAASEAATGGSLVVFSETDQVGRDITSSTVSDRFAVLRSRRD